MLIAALIAEGVLRMIAPQTLWVPTCYRMHPDIPGVHTMDVHAHQIVDVGETRYTIVTDDLGYRVPVDPYPRSGQPVLLIGDSFTFGQPVDYDQTFAGLLDKRFAGRLTFIDTGVPKHGPDEYRLVFEHHLDTQPKPAAVILGIYLGNDITSAFGDRDAVTVIDGTLYRGTRDRFDLKRFSHLVRLLDRGLDALSLDEPNRFRYNKYLYLPDAWEHPHLQNQMRLFTTECGKIVERCKTEHIPVIVLIIPETGAIEQITAERDGQPPDTTRDLRLPAKKVAEAFNAMGVPCVDTTDRLLELGAEKTYFHDDCHWKPAGHAIAAELLAKELTELLGIEPIESP